MTTKVCQNCSAMTETDKTFCPECGTVYQAAQPASASSGGQPTAASGRGVDRLTIAVAVVAGAVILSWIGQFLMYWGQSESFTEALKLNTGWWAISNEFDTDWPWKARVGAVLNEAVPLILSSTALILALIRRRRA